MDAMDNTSDDTIPDDIVRRIVVQCRAPLDSNGAKEARDFASSLLRDDAASRASSERTWNECLLALGDALDESRGVMLPTE